MECPECSAEDFATIHFDSVADGAEFHFCRRCEHRWWLAGDGSPLSLTDLLANAPEADGRSVRRAS
ncbi:MAG TPA: hypothetical protein VNE62_10515 [Actinomycetota bacterium]|nr:hypothetical protein [Actinomycetota bacterium]